VVHVPWLLLVLAGLFFWLRTGRHGHVHHTHSEIDR
jgi:hypothetical protein